MRKHDVCAVVPTCRGFRIPEQSIPVRWVIVHDRERREVEGAADHIVAPDPETFGSRCSCIRSAGFMHAIHSGADYVLTADDDVIFPITWAEDHVRQLQKHVHPWSRTTDTLVPMRGEPYDARWLPVGITHGLWANVPDLDGQTQKANPNFRIFPDGKWKRIHPPFTLSSMNFGFRREVAPVMYQPAMGDGWPFKRHDDIWLGLLCERVLQHHGYAFMNGGAVVWHTRASNVDANIIAEAAGASEHEHLWHYVWSFDNFGPTIEESYRRLADHVQRYRALDPTHDSYFTFLAENMRKWVGLVSP